MILQAFGLALGQLGDPRFRRVYLLGVVLTFLLLVAAYAGFLWLITGIFGDEITLPFLGEVLWLNDLLSISSFLVMLVLSAFLMIPVASAITSMFLDQVAQAVEDKHYPHLAPPMSVPLWDSVVDTLNFLGVLIGANILAFFLSIAISPFFPPAGPIIFYGLNGFLLGREYYTLAAMRRVGRVEAKALRKRHRQTIWVAGILMAIPLTVPLLNLLIPILGAATFTHIFHMLEAERRD